jgi:DNA-binding transcriptional ArsR family regulator
VHLAHRDPASPRDAAPSVDKRGAMTEIEPAAERPAPLLVDATNLRALAHPLRVQIYDLLWDRGSATATHLAEQLGESSGTTSYHLRVLAEHGFIEDDPDRGNRRDRWWRVRPGGFSLDSSELFEDDSSAASLQVVAGELWRMHARQIERWYLTAQQWGETWMSASASTAMRFEGTPEEMAEVRDALAEVMQRFQERFAAREEPPPGSHRIMVQCHVFPSDDPPGGDPDA